MARAGFYFGLRASRSALFVLLLACEAGGPGLEPQASGDGGGNGGAALGADCRPRRA